MVTFNTRGDDIIFLYELLRAQYAFYDVGDSSEEFNDLDFYLCLLEWILPEDYEYPAESSAET